MEREREELDLYLSKLIDDRLTKVPLTDPNCALVFNGGTGVGKTTAIMNRLLPILEEKNKREVAILIVESRSATRDQLIEEYNDTVIKEGKFFVVQRHGFAKMIEEDSLPEYDYIVLDECHSLFSDASFADDAALTSYWISEKKTNEKLIFITACDVYFDELARKFINKLTYHYFFPDFTKYYTGTAIRQLSYIKTSKLKNTIDYIMKEKKGKKGLVFLQSAKDVIFYSHEYERNGYRTGSIISKLNETSASLALTKQDYEDLGISSDVITLSQVSALLEENRIKRGLTSIREALLHKTYPEDIDVIFATNTISEGISIESQIDFIVIEGFGEEEVEQKSGRYRGNLDELFLVFYPQKFVRRMIVIEDTFAMLKQNPNLLPEYYGRQEGGAFKFKFIIKRTKDGEATYSLNIPALLAEKKKAETYGRLMAGGIDAVKQLYGHKITGEIKEFNGDSIKDLVVNEELLKIIEDFKGVLLIGPYRDDFTLKCADAGLRTGEGKQPDFRLCLKKAKELGATTKRKVVGKKDVTKNEILKPHLGKECQVFE